MLPINPALTSDLRSIYVGSRRSLNPTALEQVIETADAIPAIAVTLQYDSVLVRLIRVGNSRQMNHFDSLYPNVFWQGSG